MNLFITIIGPDGWLEYVVKDHIVFSGVGAPLMGRECPSRSTAPHPVGRDKSGPYAHLCEVLWKQLFAFQLCEVLWKQVFAFHVCVTRSCSGKILLAQRVRVIFVRPRG